MSTCTFCCTPAKFSASREKNIFVVFGQVGLRPDCSAIEASLNVQTFHVASLNVSYSMVCAFKLEDNPRALMSGLSPVHTHNHIITFLLHQHACVLCTL